METVGIRELKNHLSRHLRRVRAGARLLVTEHGRSIATITPVEPPPETEWVQSLVDAGAAHWNGGKPRGASKPEALADGSASAVVLEERR